MDKSNSVTVGVGGIHADKAPQNIFTCLGSCIAVCLYDSRHKVGGMVHIAMVSAFLQNKTGRDEEQKGKYADTAIHELLKILKNNYQLDKENFAAKIFGGAKILKTVSMDVGQNNEKAVRGVLKELGIRIAAFQTGGEKGYRVEFNLENGNVLCQTFGGEAKEY